MSLHVSLTGFLRLVKPEAPVEEPEVEYIQRHDFVFYRPATNPTQRWAAFVLETEPSTQTAYIEYCYFSRVYRAWCTGTIWASADELTLASEWDFLVA